jgi:Carboxypeptidase regulatory-like domain
MRPLVAVLATFALTLAGCASSADPKAQAAEPEPDFGGVEATETTGVIRGVVVDDAIRPIQGANVSVNGLPEVVTTTAEGAFGFDGLEPGTYFLTVTRLAHTTVQTSVEVVAGVADPPIVKVNLQRIPGLEPFVDTYAFTGFLSFGAAVFATSVGTTVYGPVADALGDRSIWTLQFTQLPQWVQGELVWEHSQPAGGMLIWEMTDTSNSPAGYRETAASPALAYWNTTVIEDHNETTLDPERGIAYRFFGGPHPACNVIFFGCGLTVQQRADAYIHNFYNFVPAEGWRFTVDGDPKVPE